MKLVDLVRTSKKPNKHRRPGTKKRIKITIKVLEEIKNEFPETAEFIDDRLQQKCRGENIIVEEVIFLFICLEAKS